MRLSEMRIGDVCEVYDGPHATPAPSKDGPIYLGIPSIRSDGSIDEAGSKRISWDDYPKWTKRVTPRENDVVFSYEANLDTYAIIPKGFVGCLGRRMAIMRPRQDMVEPLYLYYYMRSPKWKEVIAQRTVTGATVNRIPIVTYPDFPIWLPDRATQKEIVAVLSAYDNLIENSRRRIMLLEEAARRLYKEWFVDLRFPGHEATPIDPDTKLPKGWRHSTVGQLCKTVGGGTPPTRNRAYYEGGSIPWVTPTDVTANTGLFLPRPARYITPEGLASSSAKLLPAGSILMTSRASIGYFAMCEGEVCTNQGFISCIVESDDLRWWLLYELMSRTSEMRGLAKGSTFLEINKTTFREMQVNVPSEQLLRRFSSFADLVYRQCVSIRKSMDAAQEARDRLLPKLMSGEVEV